jgi:hypothetical protein
MRYSLPEYTERLQNDLRLERIRNKSVIRAHAQQKQKSDTLQEENNRLKRENEKLKKENGKLKQEIEKLTKTDNRYRVSLFDHGNFKHPDNQHKKVKGGQIGHRDTNQDTKRNYAEFSSQRLFVTSCGKCGRDLPRVASTKKKTLIDIEINTKLIQILFSSERQWCANCKQEVRAQDARTLPFTEYGINTLMVVMHLRFKGKQSFTTIATSLHNLFGLPISKSGVGTLLTQAKKYLQGKYEELKQAIRDGEIMYNDETGWQVRGKSAWMWIMANEKQTVYIAAESRGKGIMEKIYGNSKAYSMHDGYGGYTKTVPRDRQLYCWAHILRFVHEETVDAAKDTVEYMIKEKLVMIYQTIRDHPDYTVLQKEQILVKAIDEILEFRQENQTIKNMQQRIKTQKEGLIRALIITKDGTNNLGERELRPLAMSRSISYGSDTYGGMETTAVLASVIQTLSRDKIQPLLPTLKASLQKGVQNKYPQYNHIPRFAT